MKTRLLESRNILRASVAGAAVVETGPAHVVFETTAVAALKRKISSADSAMLNQRKLAQAGDKVTGRLRIDVLTDHVFRFRYAEGGAVPENATPMVVGRLAGPQSCTINPDAPPQDSLLRKAPWLQGGEPVAAGARTVELATAAVRVRVALQPFKVEIHDRDGRKLCGCGGPEKDNFCNWDSVNTGVARSLEDGSPIACESFDLHADESIYGLGEKFIRLDKVGQTIDLRMVDALGVTTPRSYKNIPFYVSTRGYGVFFNHSSLMTYWVGSLSAADVQVAAADDDFLDYFIITGSIKEVLSRYTDITGKSAVPPKWTFGYWQSKISYQSAEETLEIARRMRENEVPCDVIHLDTHWFKQDWYCDLEFAPDRFPDPAAYLKALADMGFKVSLWQLPYIPEGSKLFDDLKAVDGFVRNRDGGLYNCGICFTPGFKGIVGVVDYSNPHAVAVHQEHFRRLFRLGAKVIKTDFGEDAPLDGVYHDGTPGHRMHNLYPLLYNRALFEVTREATGDGVVWARSAWAGNQRYPLHWGGDNSPNYFNLIPQIAGGLSFGLSGFPFWSQDIGGFCGTTNDALLIRWMQLGMFISHSRIHGFGDRELYKFKPDTLRICRDYIRLRYRLMPYIYGSAIVCVRDSLPMLRALVIEYPDDLAVRNLSDEFLFGDSLLVAPVFSEDDGRQVYLPAGVWTDWWTGERIPGGQSLRVEAGLERLPLYLREGALVPLGPVMNYVDEKPTDEIELVVAAFSGDGVSRFNVPLGRHTVPVRYESRNGQHTVHIGPTDARVTVRPMGRKRIKVERS
ncbi:MAG: Alpha-xylosidase [Lentisphaerae bacterium ADurb.BinA184]|nr:MAG: Alpha-xylosidase [Lentisphaerae bacterium ADurb.BinA184]